MEAIDRDIGERVREFRAARGLTLEALAAQSGVSRAMLSRVERGESSPTAQLLNRICSGLGVTLSALFAAAEKPVSPLRRRADQKVWRDPASGYVRHAVSPHGTGSQAEIIDVEFPVGGKVAFDAQTLPGTDQQIFVLAGAMEIGVGAVRHSLRAGDCLYMRFGAPIVFRNRGPKPARYLVVISRSAGTP